MRLVSSLGEQLLWASILSAKHLNIPISLGLLKQNLEKKFYSERLRVDVTCTCMAASFWLQNP